MQELVLPSKGEIERLANRQRLEVKQREIAEIAAARREMVQSAEEANELERELKALLGVFHAKRVRAKELEAEWQRYRKLLGKLLGKAKSKAEAASLGGKAKAAKRPATSTVDVADGSRVVLHNRDKHDFRLMARHESVVEEMLAKGKTTTKAIVRRLREIEQARARAAAAKQLPEHHFYTCSCSDLRAQVAAGSVDAVITDPPYAHEHLDAYSQLSEFAAHALKPGALCVALAGQSYLPEVLERLGEHLTYHWLGCYLTPGGQASGNRARGVNAGWKPICIFSNGARVVEEGDGRSFGDVVKSAVNDNDAGLKHEWGQSESGTLDLIGRFSRTDDLIADPFLGSGTIPCVALPEGRAVVGCDIESRWVEETKARLGCEHCR